MAKSTRSKTKRSFRRAKREEYEKSTYAATHAARLDRLNKKLAAIAQPSTSILQLGEEDTNEKGWPIFALLGLVDPDEIASFGLFDGGKIPSSSSKRRRNSSSSSSSGSSESGPDADWLRALSGVAWQHLSESSLLGSLA